MPNARSSLLPLASLLCAFACHAQTSAVSNPNPNLPNLIAPEVRYDHSISLYLVNRRIDVRFMDGHTGGDSVVNIPDAGVVFCGDLFWNKTWPSLIDASTLRWDVTLDNILSLPAKPSSPGSKDTAATFVPGLGDGGGKDEDLGAFQAHLQDLRAMVEKYSKAGKHGNELVNEVSPQLVQKYSSWNYYKHFSRPNVTDMASEIEGGKRVPIPGKK
jgi:glyoxylase-like metal-dependent hydrolase (beta-lactamase superfamily II)